MEDWEEECLRRVARCLKGLCIGLNKISSLESDLSHIAVICNLQVNTILEKRMRQEELSIRELRDIVHLQAISIVCCILSNQGSFNLLEKDFHRVFFNKNKDIDVLERQIYRLLEDVFMYIDDNPPAYDANFLNIIASIDDPMHTLVTLQEADKEASAALPKPTPPLGVEDEPSSSPTG